MTKTGFRFRDTEHFLCKQRELDVKAAPFSEISKKISGALSTILSRDNGFISEEDLLAILVAGMKDALSHLDGRYTSASWDNAINDFVGSLHDSDSKSGLDKLRFMSRLIDRKSSFLRLCTIATSRISNLKFNICLDSPLEQNDLSLHSEYILKYVTVNVPWITFEFHDGEAACPLDVS